MSGVRGNPRAANARDYEMKALYEAGKTLQEIGDIYGITRERVRQLLTRYFGFRQESGGARARAADRMRKMAEAKNARCLKKLGISFDEYLEVQEYGRARAKETGRPFADPRRAFSQQRTNAGRRNIPWHLTFAEWWSLWKASGKYEQRGRGQGYVMSRKGDEGPYAVGNVFIALAAENCSETKAKKSDLPRGVIFQKRSGKYVAKRQIHNVTLHLGAFDSAEQAYAAYLAAPLPEARRAA